MSINIFKQSCSHHYEGPVDPTFPVVADDGDDSGEEWVHAGLFGEHSFPDREACISFIPSDARPCSDCIYKDYILHGLISCTFGPADPVFNGVTLTYKFKPGTLHTYYIEKRAQLFDYRTMESRSYTSAENHVKAAQASLNRFTPYVPQARPRSWIGRIVWRVTAARRRLEEARRVAESERERQELMNTLARCQREWEKQQAIRQEMGLNLELERQRMDTHLAPRLCEAMKVQVWPRILPRLVSLRVAAKVQQAHALDAADHAADWARREAAFQNGIVEGLREKGILGPPSLGSGTVSRLKPDGYHVVESYNCEIVCVSVGWRLETKFLDGSCLEVSPWPRADDEVSIFLRDIHGDLEFSDYQTHPNFNAIDCYTRWGGDYFGSYKVRQFSSSDVFRTSEDEPGSSLAADGLCRSLWLFLRTAAVPSPPRPIPLEYRVITRR